MKATDRKAPVTLRDDKLFLKGELQRKFLQPKAMKVAVDPGISIDLCVGDDITDSGSTFQGFAAHVNTMK